LQFRLMKSRTWKSSEKLLVVFHSLEYYNHYTRLWNTTNSFSDDFQVLDFINRNCNLLYHNYDYDNEQLTLTLNGIGTQVFALNCPSKGKPVSVKYSNGTTITHIYSNSTKQLTFNVTHSTRVEKIRISWSEASETTHPTIPTVLVIGGAAFGSGITFVAIYIMVRKRTRRHKLSMHVHNTYVS